jgi:predicted RNase H-like HicB family nuclease
MGHKREFKTIIKREGDGYTALCPELDVASQGNTPNDAARSLNEAVALFLDVASPAEVEQRARRFSGRRSS